MNIFSVEFFLQLQLNLKYKLTDLRFCEHMQSAMILQLTALSFPVTMISFFLQNDYQLSLSILCTILLGYTLVVSDRSDN